MRILKMSICPIKLRLVLGQAEAYDVGNGLI